MNFILPNCTNEELSALFYYVKSNSTKRTCLNSLGQPIIFVFICFYRMSADPHLSEDLSEDGVLKETYFLEDCIYEQVAVLLHGLEECRQKQLYTDVILCASEEEFPCHKVVLAASSRYFSVSLSLIGFLSNRSLDIYMVLQILSQFQFCIRILWLTIF